MKYVLSLACTALIVAGCSSTQTARQSPARAQPYATTPLDQPVDVRVEGERAREAGLQSDRWHVTRKDVAAETTAAEPVGGAPVVARETTIEAESGGLLTMDAAEIQLHKEELVVGKREVSNGGVLIKTVVQTRDVSQPIELRREEYVIERIPAGATEVARSDAAFHPKEIYIALTREEPVAGIRTLVTEQVQLGKRSETDHQVITRPVRSEDIEIVKNPDLSQTKFSALARHPEPSFKSTEVIQGATAGQGENLTAERTAALQLAKEEMVLGKREVSNGGVFLQKAIRTQDASQPVDLRREEFDLARTPRSEVVPSADFRPREIRMNLVREEPVAGTRTYVAETLRVRKQIHTDSQIVSGKVRNESLEVVKLSGTTTAAQGGTGSSIESGVTSTSETGYTSAPETEKDRAISESVRAALKTAGSTPDSSMIAVTTHDGVVTLRGTVSSEAEKKQFGKQVKAISGVRSIKNELKVAAPAK